MLCSTSYQPLAWPSLWTPGTHTVEQAASHLRSHQHPAAGGSSSRTDSGSRLHSDRQCVIDAHVHRVYVISIDLRFCESCGIKTKSTTSHHLMAECCFSWVIRVMVSIEQLFCKCLDQGPNFIWTFWFLYVAGCFLVPRCKTMQNNLDIMQKDNF